MEKSLKLYSFVDGTNDVAFPSEENQIEINAFRYSAKRMGDIPTITATVKHFECLDNVWTDKVYAEFNGEKYYLKQTPSCSFSNEDSRYIHEIELVSERIILNNVYFFDAVSDNVSTDRPVSNSTKFSFFGDINAFAERLNHSLTRSDLLVEFIDGTFSGYKVFVDEGISSEEKFVSFEDKFFSEAIQECYNTFEIPYYFKGHEIHFGYSGDVPSTILKYGIDYSLLGIKRENANYKVVNRATGTGSSDNIPYYYPNNSPKGDITVEAPASLGVKITDYEKFAEALGIDESIVFASLGAKATGLSTKITPEDSGGDLIWSYLGGIRRFVLKINSTYSGKCTLAIIISSSNIFKYYKNGYPDESEEPPTAAFPSAEARVYVNGEQFDAAKSINTNAYFDIDVLKGANTVEISVRYDFGAQTPGVYVGNPSLSYSLYSSTQWFYDGRKVDFSDFGLSIENPNSATAGDAITQRLIRYVNTSPNLMPYVYRQTYGEERFYNGINGAYKDEEGNDIVFPNPYVEGHPSEQIVSFDDIKPTIKEMKNSSGQRIDMFADIAFDEDDNDETYVDEDGNTMYKHPHFFVKLRKLPFNLFDCAIENGEMTISITGGSCGACSFKVKVDDEYPYLNPVQVDASGNLKYDSNGMVLCGVEGSGQLVVAQDIQQDTINHEVWIALEKEEDTYGFLMPKAPKYSGSTLVESGYRPKACSSDSTDDGDTFVILNINLPTAYIENAEKKLEKEIIKYILENNSEKFNFSITLSRIFLEENPDVLALLNENTRLNIEYNGETYTLYVSNMEYAMNDGEILPSISVELVDTLEVSQNAIQNAISQVKSEVSTALGNIDIVSRANPFFIRKDVDDIANGIVNFRRGIKFSDGGRVTVDENNNTKLTIDYLDVKKKAVFNSLEIQAKTHVGGQLLVTPASILCNRVVKNNGYYRCYFQQYSDDGDEIFNDFAIDDQAICQSFNAYKSIYYWRLVVGVGANYIDLSVSDCDEGSDIPQAGDKIIQLGNRSDKNRQNAIIISSYGDNTPSIYQYAGICDYTLPKSQDDRIVTKLAPDENIIRGKMTFLSGSSGLENIPSWNNLVEKVDTNYETLQDYINELQDQVDGVVETWFGEGIPTLDNAPAVGWVTDVIKNNHLGDLYYDNTTGTAYRFSHDNSGYFWNVITDEAITKALAAAQKAQDTADGKRRVFTNVPTVPYDEGDLWVNATYPTGTTQASRNPSEGKYWNDLLRCNTSRNSGSFTISEWGLASAYTDDSALEEFIDGYEDTIKDIKTQIDGKAETWYQSTNPAAAWTTSELKASHKGDLWYCTSDIAGTSFLTGTTWYWDGTSWKEQDIPKSVFDTIDGKSSIFISKPTNGYKKNDLWFLESAYTLSGVSYEAGTLVVAIRDINGAWSADDWSKKDNYVDKPTFDSLFTGGQNLLRNSGFTGDYLSETLADDNVLTEAAKMFSSPLDHWSYSGATVQDSENATSGKEVVLSGGKLEQSLYFKAIPNSYIVSFIAKGTTISIKFGTETYTQALTNTATRYSIKFTLAAGTYAFSIYNATCTLYDLQLEGGTRASAWKPSPFDNQSDRAYYQSLWYLAGALDEGSTTVNGGLVLTNHIKVGNYANKEMVKETGGMQGTWTSDSSPFLWGGGSNELAISTIANYESIPSGSEVTGECNFVVTHGGRLIANDAIIRGTIYAKDGVFSGEVNATSGKIGAFDITGLRLGIDGENKSKSGMFLYNNYIGFRRIYDSDGSYSESLFGADVNPTFSVFSSAVIYRHDETGLHSPASGLMIILDGMSIGKALYLSSDCKNESVALEVAKGDVKLNNCYVKGFNPAYTLVSSGTISLSLEQYTICVNGTTTFTLPDNPPDGKSYEFWQIKGYPYLLTINSNDKEMSMVYAAGEGYSVSEYSFSVAFKAFVKISYVGGKWHIFVLVK